MLNDATPDSLALLQKFYKAYEEEFPDPDERESLGNMEKALQGNCDQARASTYLVTLVLIDGEPIGGRVTDYFHNSNTALVEYWVVAREYQGKGVGGRLATRSDKELKNLAEANGRKGVSATYSEVNDPLTYVSSSGTETPEKNLGRLKVYARRTGNAERSGMRIVDLPYEPPPLSEDQEGIKGLKLVCELEPGQTSVPGDAMKGALHDFMKYAMRIDDPKGCEEYKKMAEHIDRVADVQTVPLLDYIAQVEKLMAQDKEALAQQQQALALDVNRAYYELTGRRMAYDYAMKYAKELWAQNAAAHYKKAGSIREISKAFDGQQTTTAYDPIKKNHAHQLRPNLQRHAPPTSLERKRSIHR